MQSNNITTHLWCIAYEGIKSLCCIPETNIIFLAYCIPIKKKKKKKKNLCYIVIRNQLFFFFCQLWSYYERIKNLHFFLRNKFSQKSVQDKRTKTCERSWGLLQVPFRYFPGPPTCSPHQYTVWLIHTGISAKPQIIACYALSLLPMKSPDRKHKSCK